MRLDDPNILHKINNATKYPSIPTYHKLDAKGQLTEEHNIEFVGEIIGTEKIDGVNSRIILPPMEWGNIDWIIGSRAELLHASGDTIHNPAVQIVETLKPWLNQSTTPDKLANLDEQYSWPDRNERRQLEGDWSTGPNYFVVLYLESFGGKQQTAAWKQYSKDGTPAFRLFDIALIPTEVIGWEDAAIASWRDNHKQTWLTNDQLMQAGQDLGIALTPCTFQVPATEWPTSIQGVYDFMMSVCGGASSLALPEGAGGRSEGFVIRTPSSNKIAKLRFHEYRRALGVK